MSEQREAPRVDTALSATVAVGKRRVAFCIDDLSTGGARLSGALPLALEQRIELSLELDGESLALEAEVVRVHTADLLTDQAAVRFIDVPRDYHDAIDRFVSTVLARSDDERETVPIQRV